MSFKIENNYKNINWDIIKKKSDIFIHNNTLILENIFKKKYNKKIIKKFFELPLSSLFLNIDLIRENKLYYLLLNSYRALRYTKKIKIYNNKKKKILELDFFFRHQEYKTNFFKRNILNKNQIIFNPLKKFETIKLFYKILFFLLSNNQLNFSTKIYLIEYVAILYSNEDLIYSNDKFKYILISDHAIMNIYKKLIFSIFSINGKVLYLQSAFAFSHIKWFDKQEYALKYCDHYLAYSDFPKNNKKVMNIGSFYSSKKSNKKIINKTIVYLPWLDMPNFRTAMSSYAFMKKSEFISLYENELVSDIKYIIKKCNNENLIFSSKFEDFEYYELLFKNNNILNKLKYSQINIGKFSGSYKKSIIMYYSTAFIENFYSKTKCYIYIGCCDISLVDQLNSKIPRNKIFKLSPKYMSYLSNKTNVKNFEKKFKDKFKL